MKAVPRRESRIKHAYKARVHERRVNKARMDKRPLRRAYLRERGMR